MKPNDSQQQQQTNGSSNGSESANATTEPNGNNGAPATGVHTTLANGGSASGKTTGSSASSAAANNKSGNQQQPNQQSQTGSRTSSAAARGDEEDQSGADGEQNPGKMFIGGLSWNTTAEGLRDYFSKFGEVNECMVMRDPATKRARGFGFIVFANPESVDKVLLVNDHELDGKKIDPKVAFPKRHQPKMVVRTKKVFIGGLSSNSTIDDIQKYFQQYGKIEDVMLMFDKATQRHRGFAFIVFEDIDVADRVCEVHFHEINGKMVECKKAQPKEVMLPVQLNKSRAAASRNLYGLSPEQLLAYASYVPRMPYTGGNLLYPGLFNGFSQSFSLNPSGRSSVSNTGAMNASSSRGVNAHELAAAQVAAQQQAVYEAAVAYAQSIGGAAAGAGDFNFHHGGGSGGAHHHHHHHGIPSNNYNNKM